MVIRRIRRLELDATKRACFFLPLLISMIEVLFIYLEILDLFLVLAIGWGALGLKNANNFLIIIDFLSLEIVNFYFI